MRALWRGWAAAGFLPLPAFVSCGSPARVDAAPAVVDTASGAPDPIGTPKETDAPVVVGDPSPVAEPERGDPPLERPSWAYYPSVDPRLADAVRDGKRADVVLRMVAATLAPHRWATLEDWDNMGFINLEPESPAGWVTRRSGELKSQLAGEYQLGCAGGYLEGVRAVLVPDLGMTDLERCDASALARLGPHAPQGCPDEAFGIHAIAATAEAAARRGVSSSEPTFIHVDHDALARPDVFDTRLPSGTVSVCTVSHRAKAFGGVRYHHHLMIVVRPSGRGSYQVFDTTGYGGVQVREMSGRYLAAYSANALAMNRRYEYDPASAHVDCFAITRRR